MAPPRGHGGLTCATVSFSGLAPAHAETTSDHVTAASLLRIPSLRKRDRPGLATTGRVTGRVTGRDRDSPSAPRAGRRTRAEPMERVWGVRIAGVLADPWRKQASTSAKRISPRSSCRPPRHVRGLSHGEGPQPLLRPAEWQALEQPWPKCISFTPRKDQGKSQEISTASG